jgi:hypothetical protein
MRHGQFSLRGRRGRLALRLALLALPVLFWSAVFAVLAGVRPVQRLVAVVPEAAHVFVALACPLVAVILGAAALRDEGCARSVRDGSGAALGRLTVAAGATLFVFAVLASLGPA